MSDAFGAGDATTVPSSREGSPPSRPAVAAHAIARAAGADVAATMRPDAARTRCGRDRRDVVLDAGCARRRHDRRCVSDAPLWHPSTKVSMPYLASYLQRVGADVAE